MEATENNATAQRPFIEKPSLPSDLEIEYQFPIEDTNRPDTSAAGGTLHSLPVQEPRQARADDANRRNESENGDRLLLYQKMEVNVNVKNTRMGTTPGLSTQTGAREEEPPFPTKQGTGGMFSHDDILPQNLDGILNQPFCLHMNTDGVGVNTVPCGYSPPILE